MDADTKEAKILFEEGVKLYKGGKYEEARVKFKAAYGLKKRPSIVLNLANAELQTKRPLEAVGHYKELIGMADAKADDKAEAQTGLTDAKKQIATVVVDAPTGTTVVVDGENRQVPVDGEIYLMPGSHTIVVKLAKEIVEKPNLIAGQVYTVKPKAETAPPVVVPPPVATTPPPAATTEPPPAATTPPPAATTEPPPPPPPPEQKDTGKRGFFDGVHPVTYASAGLVVVGVVGWIAFGLNAKTHDDNVTKLYEAFKRPICGPGVTGTCATQAHHDEYAAQGKDEVSAADRARTWSTVSAIVAGVAVAGTVITYVALRKPAEKQVAFVAAPTWGGASFSLVGTF
ncbi:MAG: hypothetical protein ACXWUG_11785 [Polyangiales bacterium]